MISLNNVKILASNSLGRTGLVLAKRSPEILLGAGIIGVVAATVLACRATLKVEKVVEEAKNELDLIDSTREKVDDLKYSDADAQRDIVMLYVKTGVEVAKLYMPSIAVMGISVALIVKSHGVLSKRNAGLAAAYKLVDEAFKKYRQRVKDEYGDEADRKLRFGQKEITVLETKANGKQKEVTKKIYGDEDILPFTFTWCEENATQYQRNYDMNLFFLRTQQQYANDLLTLRGHIFLNEILDGLGLPRTREGAVIGWLKGENPHNPSNDQYVDFGLNDPVNEEKGDPYEAMVQPWHFNFNVDGNIWDAI
jgi:hypothetical protein